MSKKLQILIALDFDETIVHSHPFPKIKGFRRGAKKYINKLYDQGYYIVIWTCRTDKLTCMDATIAENFLLYNGVKFHLFNDNHPALQKRFGNNSRKVSADLYVDDKGLWLFKIPSWFWLYWIIKIKSLFLKDDRKIISHCKPQDFE